MSPTIRIVWQII